MGAQDVQRLTTTALLLIASLAPSQVWAVDAAVRAPQRLTAGPSDQFLGTLSDDGKALYFISNRNATAQVFRKVLGEGPAELLFDESADVSIPRVSPDGTKLLYISTRDDASGDVCIRHIQTGVRRCLTGPGTSETQALWFADGKSVGVVGRRGMHGDLHMHKMGTGPLGGSEIIVDENLSGPALSPDNRWLVWLPVERASKFVGISFAMRATGGLALRRLDGKDRINASFQLPGVTGYPAFSADGAWLYFAQHLSDTNFDGRIDGEDHSVLFRVRFDGRRKDPLDGAVPEQLTSARWNCQYPQPARDRLVMTCHMDGSLDIYELPLDGAVPSQWRADKLHEALAASRDRWERLLLLDKLLRLQTDRAKRHDLHVQVTWLHLELGEYASAKWHTEQVGRGDGQPPSKDIATWAKLVLELIAQRGEEQLLNRGELNERFIASQRQRLWKLALLARGATPDRQALAKLAMMEIHDVIGEKKLALAALNGINAAKVGDPLVLQLLADRPATLLRRVGDRDGELALLRDLATNEALAPSERVAMADRLVAALTRGRDRSERRAVVDAWLGGTKQVKKAEKDSELAFRLELESLLLALPRPANQAQAEPVREKLFKAYRYHREFERRKVLIGQTMRAATRADSGYLMYQFSNTWVSNVSRKNAEYPTALALFRQVYMERAYIEWQQKNAAVARANFFSVTLQIDDLEATTGFIEALAAEGKDPAPAFAQQYRRRPTHPVYAFAKAYLLVRELPAASDPSARGAALDQADELLKPVFNALARDPGLHQLLGYIAHQRFLLTAENQNAVLANGHYVMALDLARNHPRHAAAIVLAIATLQASVGNHFIALEYLQRRAKLPIDKPLTQLAVHLFTARSLYQVGKAKDAVKAAQQAVAFIDAHPEMSRLLPLALDAAGLYGYAAGAFAQAEKSYIRLLALPPHVTPNKPGADAGQTRANRMRALMMAGACALAHGDHDGALPWLQKARDAVDTIDDDSLAIGRTRWRKTPDVKAADILTLIDGLLAEALTGKGKLDEANAALNDRANALKKRLGGSDEDNLLLQLAATRHSQAVLAERTGAPDDAAKLLEQGLALTDRHAQRTGTKTHRVRVQLTLAYAALHLYGKVAIARLSRDPTAVLSPVYAAMCRHPNPARATERFTLKLYLSMLTADTRKPR